MKNSLKTTMVAIYFDIAQRIEWKLNYSSVIKLLS